MTIYVLLYYYYYYHYSGQVHGPTQIKSWQHLDDAVCEVKYSVLQNEQSDYAHFQFDVNDMEKVLNLTKESGSTCFLKEFIDNVQRGPDRFINCSGCC